MRSGGYARLKGAGDCTLWNRRGGTADGIRSCHYLLRGVSGYTSLKGASDCTLWSRSGGTADAAAALSIIRALALFSVNPGSPSGPGVEDGEILPRVPDRGECFRRRFGLRSYALAYTHTDTHATFPRVLRSPCEPQGSWRQYRHASSAKAKTWNRTILTHNLDVGGREEYVYCTEPYRHRLATGGLRTQITTNCFIATVHWPVPMRPSATSTGPPQRHQIIRCHRQLVVVVLRSFPV
jgi:hypothetical protein